MPETSPSHSTCMRKSGASTMSTKGVTKTSARNSIRLSPLSLFVCPRRGRIAPGVRPDSRRAVAIRQELVGFLAALPRGDRLECCPRRAQPPIDVTLDPGGALAFWPFTPHVATLARHAAQGAGHRIAFVAAQLVKVFGCELSHHPGGPIRQSSIVAENVCKRLLVPMRRHVMSFLKLSGQNADAGHEFTRAHGKHGFTHGAPRDRRRSHPDCCAPRPGCRRRSSCRNP